VEAYRRALQLDPVSPFLNAQFLSLLVDAGRYEQANQQFRKAIEVDPNSRSAYAQAGGLYHLQGRDGEALAAWLKADSLGDGNAEQLKALENAARAGGVHGYWKKRLEVLRGRAQHGRVPPLDFASLYVRIGEKDKAIQMLEAAYQQRSLRLTWIRAHAVWRPLHSDPRFQSLLRRMRFPE
jgi:tetratricopeptide (TPR) repeat protein